MLNNVVFINRLPADSRDLTIYHGDSRQIIRESISDSKWRFGCAAAYEEHGEGLQYPGESQAVDDFFHFNADAPRSDALASRQIHDSINSAHKDQYNTCWSTSLEAARRFGRKYDDGVIVSVQANAFADSLAALAREWSTRAHQARRDDLDFLLSGNQAGIQDAGWGRIHASASFIEYLPIDYCHSRTSDINADNIFMSPIYRNTRLPESHHGLNLQSELELRFSLDLSNSDGCRQRNPEGVANSLAPMITEAFGAEGKNGIWLHGFGIASIKGYTLTDAWE